MEKHAMRLMRKREQATLNMPCTRMEIYTPTPTASATLPTPENLRMRGSPIAQGSIGSGEQPDNRQLDPISMEFGPLGYAQQPISQAAPPHSSTHDKPFFSNAN